VGGLSWRFALAQLSGADIQSAIFPAQLANLFGRDFLRGSRFFERFGFIRRFWLCFR
jgi:hypothetical protein